MAYQRKTKDVWYVLVDYKEGLGYEEVCGGSYAEAKADLKAYRANTPQFPSKLCKRREPNV
jgi:hypothetical protein